MQQIFKKVLGEQILFFLSVGSFSIRFDLASFAWDYLDFCNYSKFKVVSTELPVCYTSDLWLFIKF